MININRNKDMTLRPKRSTHKSSDLYWTMFTRQSSHLSVNKTERVLFVLSFTDHSQFLTLRTSQGWGTRFCAQMISLDETWRNDCLETRWKHSFTFHVSKEFLMNYALRSLFQFSSWGYFTECCLGHKSPISQNNTFDSLWPRLTRFSTKVLWNCLNLDSS